MANYVVNLEEEGPLPGERGRREVYETNLARSTRFRQELLRWLDEQGLSAQVAGVGEPLAFPLLTLTCTPTVARRIETLPGVDAVFEDNAGIGLVR